MVTILGAYTTKFGELWEKSLEDLIRQACLGAIKDSGISKNKIEAIFVGNMLSGIFHNQENIGSLTSSILNLCVPAFKVEGACASGGLAVHNGVNSILAGQYKTVLVLGVEKMTDYKQEEISTALMAAASKEEQEAGLTFPGLYALMAKAHMQKYKTSEKETAFVSVKNHYHACLNGKAHFNKKINIDNVLNSPYVAEPLKLLDCSPISDGASAVILTAKLKVQSPKSKVKIIASEVATDSLSLTKRKDLTFLKAAKLAAKRAYQKAEIKIKDIDVAEVHDCFSIAEIMALEDLGFCKKGKAGKRLLNGEFKLGSKGMVVNISGGLKACGHPVGATGIKQIVEIFDQLSLRAGKKQVPKAHIGLTHNVGGSGAVCAVHILQTL